MKKKNKLLKIIISLIIAESVYLFAVPFAVNSLLDTNYVKNIISNKTNANIHYEKLKLKTHINPALSFSVEKLNITSKETNEKFLTLNNSKAQIALFPLIQKKLNLKELSSENAIIYLEKDTEGLFNFEKLFPKKKKTFKLLCKNSQLNLNNLSLSFEDKGIGKNALLNATPFSIKMNSKKKTLEVVIKSKLSANNQTSSNFDINIKTQYPFNKTINSDFINGNIIAYNIDLALLKPFITKYFSKNTRNLDGFIDFIQISAEQNDNKENQIILNTTFKNIIYDHNGWENFINAKGTNKLNSKISILNDTIKIKSFSYLADKINIKADGQIELKDKPILDINAEIGKSRVENIVSILPPNLVKKTMIIEKVKRYGVYGDIEGKINAKGKIPQPDITGYVKGRNIHVLDKSIHKLHTGKVDITFNKRILNMDILVDMFDNQKATVKGYTYMFRDGINNVTIKTTDNIDFPLAQKIIIPVSKVFSFQLGPIPEMDITSGKGLIDLNIQGSIDYINLNGFADFNNAKLTYNGLYGEITEGKGRLDFKEDTISFKSEKAFAEGNPINVEGKVRINNNLDFNISTPASQAKDVLKIIRNSELLKDVKEGLAIITDANGALRLFLNIKSNIVPVPYGHPPLPPEEAFEDMKVKGSVYMLGNTCKIEGFYTPIEKIKGIVDFTETMTTLQGLEGVVGTSPVKITGEILNDIETKIPDIDITITSKSVNLKDTIKFLAESYMYPKESPSLSAFYNIASKHDLYFTYKAKSIDFVTDRAYAVMNIIPDGTNSALKATSGKVTMKDSTVYVDNVIGKLYDSTLKINGNIEKVDTTNPEYNLKINTNNFNMANLNDTSRLEILPQEIKKALKQFSKYYGTATAQININRNMLDGKIDVKHLQAEHSKSRLPFSFDNFAIMFKESKIYINDLTAQLGDIPLYGNITISDLYKTPYAKGFITSKITNSFIENYLPASISNKFIVQGDINLSAKFDGTQDNFNLYSTLTFNPDSDLIFDGTNLGEISDKREFDSYIRKIDNKIIIEKFDYIKHIASQNNKTFPINFATINGELLINNDNIIIPKEINIKTNKNISARVLNVFFKNKVFSQGTFNADLKYNTNPITNIGKVIGKVDCKNIDIPIFDTVIKNIEIIGNKEDIDIKLLGFMGDSRIRIDSLLNNKIGMKPKIKSLNIQADQIDNNKLFEHLSKTHKAMETNNNIKNIDLSGLSIENGNLEIKKVIVKSMIANNFISDFSIDKNGIFKANNTKVEVGDGHINGEISYNLKNNELKGNFELANVDANYVAETLFDAKNQIYGNANGKIILKTVGHESSEIIKNLSGFVYFDVSDGKMPKLGSLEYLLRASNIIKSGISSFTINNVLELLNLVKTGHFSNINGTCEIENGIAKNIEIFSQGENLSLYIHGNYDISQTNAQLEILGKLSKKISTVFGTIGNTSLNSFFKLIPGISLLDFHRKNFIEDVEKIPSFTNGNYDSKTFQAIINGNINSSSSVQSFKWVQ